MPISRLPALILAGGASGFFFRNPGVSGGMSSGLIGSPVFLGAARGAWVDINLSLPATWLIGRLSESDEMKIGVALPSSPAMPAPSMV